jgi:hypothetical protein
MLPPIGLVAQPGALMLPFSPRSLPRTVPLSSPWSCSCAPNPHIDPLVVPPEHRRASKEQVSLVCRAMRNGQVLRRQTILKADHFPSCYNRELPEQIEGAPNFRQVSNMPVYGLGAPTARGLRSTCARVAPRGETIVWINLREEPVVYIHGRPFCVKDRNAPFRNLENGAGIARTSVEQAELLLKKEVLAEVARFGGRLLVTDETQPLDTAVAAWGESYCYWESGIDAQSVCTCRELYQQLRDEGAYDAFYYRVPITDESAPLEADFDTIVNAIGSTVERRAFVFNCQLGRGRTTTGMAIACVAWRSIAGDAFNQTDWDMDSVKLLPEPGASKPAAADGGVPEGRIEGRRARGTSEPDGSKPRDLKQGEYEAVVTLVSRIASGARRKHFVDCAINKCAYMQNLREDIQLKKDRAETLSSAIKRKHVRAPARGARRALRLRSNAGAYAARGDLA